MWGLIAQLGIYGGLALYHKLTQKDPPPPEPRWIELPQSEEGGSPPLVFGRVRVHKPILAQFPDQVWTEPGFPIARYVLGIPFRRGIHRLHRVYYGDLWSPSANIVPDSSSHSGVFKPDADVFGVSNLSATVDTLEFGAEDTAGGASPADGRHYRGYLMAWCVLDMQQPSLPDIDFELMTHAKTDTYFPGSGIGSSTVLLPGVPPEFGYDASPLDIICALLCDDYGKLGETPSTVIDAASFTAASLTLRAEGLGMSIAWEERKTTREMIDDVLMHIDAALWHEPNDGKWHIKLIRGDYDYDALPELTTNNCTIVNFEAGSTDGLVNAVRIEYEDRDVGYQIKTVVSEDQAAAMSADEERIESLKRAPGCKTETIARIRAARELAWSSSPLIRCRALAGMQMEDLRPGHVVKVTYPELQMAGRAMRVANVSLGLATDNRVILDLVEDVFSIYRRQVNPHVGTHANPGGLPLSVG
jgi:hypothetical protein